MGFCHSALHIKLLTQRLNKRVFAMFTDGKSQLHNPTVGALVAGKGEEEGVPKPKPKEQAKAKPKKSVDPGTNKKKISNKNKVTKGQKPKDEVDDGDDFMEEEAEEDPPTDADDEEDI